MGQVSNGAQVNGLVVAGLVLPTAGLIILTARIENSTVNCTFRRQQTLAGYTPSGALKFRAKAIEWSSYGAITLADFFTLRQSDNDVGFDTATALTNGVILHPNIQGNLTTTIPRGQKAIDVLLPNGKYLTAVGSLTSGFQMDVYGYEEA